MNGTRCDIRPAMKATSRLRRSSLATATWHLSFFAAFNAAFNSGRRSRASEPLPVSTSVNSRRSRSPPPSRTPRRRRVERRGRGRSGPGWVETR